MWLGLRENHLQAIQKSFNVDASQAASGKSQYDKWPRNRWQKCHTMCVTLVCVRSKGKTGVSTGDTKIDSGRKKSFSYVQFRSGRTSTEPGKRNQSNCFKTVHKNSTFIFQVPGHLHFALTEVSRLSSRASLHQLKGHRRSLCFLVRVLLE